MAAGGLVYVLLILPASEKHPMRIDPSGTSNDHYKIDIPTSFLPFFLLYIIIVKYACIYLLFLTLELYIFENNYFIYIYFIS